MSTKPTANYGTIPTSTFTDGAFIPRATQALISPRRPWSEFLSLSSISLPSSYSESTARIRRNFNYFRFNYAQIVLIIIFLGLLWHPISMIVFLVIFVLWVFLYFSRDRPIVIFNRTVDDRLVLGLLGMLTVVSLVMTRVGLNVLVSLVVAVVVIALHASFRCTDDLFLSEDDVIEGELGSDVEQGQPLRTTYVRV